jgi:glycosyltransferase involved in cell wall biosynthesis
MLMAKKLEQRLGIKIKNNIVILPPGIDLKVVEDLRQRSVHSIEPKSSFRIGFVGWLTEWQGLDILLDAVKRLKEKIFNVELFIIGDGPLRKFIESTCKKENIKYVITGFVSHEKALEYISCLDVLVVPRKKSDTIESVIPLKAVEALALGVPVVATEQEVYYEYGFRNYENIVLCRQDPQNISSAILMILSNHDLKEKLKRNGIKMAKSFDYEKMVDKLIGISARLSAL